MGLPKNWNKITLEKYALLEKTRLIEPSNTLEWAELQVTRLSIITGQPESEYQSMTMDELQKVVDFMAMELPTKIVKQFRVNGQVYRFKMNPNKSNAGEFISVMNACKEDTVENLYKILFTIAEPIKWYGKKMTIDPDKIEERMNEFKQLTLDVAHPIALFFWTLSKNLLEGIQKSLDENLKTITQRQTQAKDSLKSLDTSR